MSDSLGRVESLRIGGSRSTSGSIVTTQDWDDDSRLTSQKDANGHATTTAFDAVGRVLSVTYADSTVQGVGYDADSHPTMTSDQNGTRVAQAYDGADRLLSRAVTPAPGVVGSISEAFQYDGLNRLTQAMNSDLSCVMGYDSLSNRTLDQQGSLSVASTYDKEANRLSLSYPGFSGTRTLVSEPDALNRLRRIRENGSDLATWSYKGPGRVEKRTYGSGSYLTLGYDARPWPIDLDHRTGAGAGIVDFQYGHDRAGHRLFENRILPLPAPAPEALQSPFRGKRKPKHPKKDPGEVYTLDSVYRLTKTLQDVDLTGVLAGEEIRPENYTSDSSLAWVYDGVGNRITSTKTVFSTPTITTYDKAPGDAEVNQYTTLSGGQSLSLTYDLNGNLTSDGTHTYAYDFKNRLVEVRDQATANLVAQFSYDALNRRFRKLASGVTTVYLLDGNQVVEDLDGSGAVLRQYVWGPGVDELLQERTVSDTWYAHEDARGDICALTDASGVVVERYAYDPFGARTITLDGGTGNEYGFQGARHDAETPWLLFMRRRTEHLILGRFMQRDPIGIWSDEVNLGNGYSFVGNDPVDGRDPEGLYNLKDMLQNFGEKYGGEGAELLKNATQHGYQFDFDEGHENANDAAWIIDANNVIHVDAWKDSNAAAYLYDALLDIQARTTACKCPQKSVSAWVISLSASGFCPYFLGGGLGIDFVKFPDTGWTTYFQAGGGAGTPGAGVSLEMGPVWGLQSRKDYLGWFVQGQGELPGGSLTGFIDPTGAVGGFKAGPAATTPGVNVQGQCYWMVAP